MVLVERGQPEAHGFGPVTISIDGEDEGEGCSRPAEGVDPPEHFDRRPGDSGQQAAPGKDDRDAIGSAGELGRQAFDGSPHVD
jgi:hypothetical protein